MHYLQQNIIKILATRESARYSEIKPKTIESNHFLYHLNQLIKEGMVSKLADKSYILSDKGKSYIDSVSFSSFKVRSQPKIVNLLVCKNDKGQYLLYKRVHQPFIGQVGFPYGKIHLGETIGESSQRELRELTGLSAKLTHRGDAYVTVFHGDVLITHTLFHVHYSDNQKGELNPGSQYGSFFWDSIDDEDVDRFFPGFIEVYRLIQNIRSDKFFEEYTFKL
jgi:ADP-ribose pyrophosphatase YjhB (NUDIX family)